MYHVTLWDTGEIISEFSNLPTAKRYARGMGHTGEDTPVQTGFPPLAYVANDAGEVVYNPRFHKQIYSAAGGLIRANDHHLR